MNAFITDLHYEQALKGAFDKPLTPLRVTSPYESLDRTTPVVKVVKVVKADSDEMPSKRKRSAKKAKYKTVHTKRRI